MLKKFKSIATNAFRSGSLSRNILVLAGGTAGAQAITMLFSPVIARMYSPEMFGVQNSFAAIIMFIGPLASMSYPLAVVLPSSSVEAKKLITLSVGIALIATFVVSCFIFLNVNGLFTYSLLSDLGNAIWLLPFFLIIGAIRSSSEQWIIRQKQFWIATKIGVFTALISNLSKVLLGFWAVSSFVLILSNFAGLLLGLLMVGWFIFRKSDSTDSVEPAGGLWSVACKYRDFPLYRTPQIAISSAANGLPILMLGAFFGMSSAGYYGLARSVVGLPLFLVGGAVYKAIYPDLAERNRNGESLYPVLLKSTLSLAAFGIFPFGILIIFGPVLFATVFGSTWLDAGAYARWISVGMFFALISRPAIAAIPVMGMQKLFLFFEVVSILLKAVAIYAAYVYLGCQIYAVAAFTVVTSLSYLLILLVVVVRSRHVTGNAIRG